MALIGDAVISLICVLCPDLCTAVSLRLCSHRARAAICDGAVGVLALADRRLGKRKLIEARIIKLRAHKSEVCVWADLANIAHIETLEILAPRLCDDFYIGYPNQLRIQINITVCILVKWSCADVLPRDALLRRLSMCGGWRPQRALKRSITAVDSVVSPMLTVRVLMLSGHNCSVEISSNCKFFELKRSLKKRLNMSKREMLLLVGDKVPCVGATLASVFGVTSGSVDVTLVRTPATCLRCGADRVQYCERCRATYCSVACQRADWRNHRRTCLKAAA